MVAGALVALIGLVVAGILIALLGSERQYLWQTDRYEALRLPATLIVDDARFAALVDCTITRLTLYQDESLMDYIEYRLEKVGSVATAPYRLRREVNIGGVSTIAYVGEDFAVQGSTKSRFYCPYSDIEKSVQFLLVRRANGGPELRYQGTALLR
jgi:hypothetical protein